MALIGGLMAFWAVAASAQPGAGWTRAADGEGIVKQYNPTTLPASAQPLCGTERTIGTVRVHIVCPDWPMMRAVSGFYGFPDQKGQQVFVRSTDQSVTAFRITLRYRKGDTEHSVVQFADADAKYDSGVGWVLGDVEIVRVGVVELRDVAAAVVQ